MNDTIELRKDSLGKWRWHVRAANGRVTDQGQAHRWKWNAKRAALRAHPNLPVITV
jgi:uncharacterized protein YegP (UPF0339 family)